MPNQSGDQCQKQKPSHIFPAQRRKRVTKNQNEKSQNKGRNKIDHKNIGGQMKFFSDISSQGQISRCHYGPQKSQQVPLQIGKISFSDDSHSQQCQNYT